ncbi:MAG: TM2 domain-containing protein, partial [Planctomycetaceae bacterium]
MVDRRIQLKDPWIAGVLAWLVPGAGHFYQGRNLKGAIYLVCILGLFLSGWAMADWSAVQPPDVREPTRDKTRLLKYTAQLGVGLPSLYALIQSRRFASETNVRAKSIDRAINAEFEGTFVPVNFPHPGDLGSLLHSLERSHQEVEEVRSPLDDGVPAIGTIQIEPIKTDLGAEAIAARFTGTIDGVNAEVTLDPAVLEEPIRATARRLVFASARDATTDQRLGVLVASIPRPLADRAGVPMSPGEENQLHARFGNQLEVWLVFTWIAGLLNMLAIWDAIGGP